MVARHRLDTVSQAMLERARYALLDVAPADRERLVDQLEWNAIFRLEDRVKEQESQALLQRTTS